MNHYGAAFIYFVLTSVVNADRIDELVEKAGGTTPPLEYSDSLRSHMVWEQLYEESW